ncbi:MAG: thioredoxin family protein, partial [Verrucomicrobiae bacterium]|nr:thioredoxin family protein [Verrucomicrobiae bacterium]
MTFTHKTIASLGLFILLSVLSQAAEIKGMSRNEIVERFGEPQSNLKGGSREILNYPQGKIVLVDDRVASFDGRFDLDEASVQVVAEPSAAQASNPPVETVSVPKPVEATPVVETSEAPDMSRRSVEPFWWSHTLAEAKKRSLEKNGRPILALFTGPDWCAPCQQLEAEVLDTAEFKRIGRKQYIPLKLALYMNIPQSPAAKEEYHRLSQEFGISAVPSFAILDSEGNLIARPDLQKRRKGVTNLTEQVIAAINDAEESSGGLDLKWKIGIGLALGGV